LNQLVLENVRKTFPGDVEAVDDVSLEVAESECLSIVGPSGSGKTTVLRVIAGFEMPTSGRIRLGSAIIAGERHFTPPESRGIGMVFQEGALFPHLTVERNIEFGLASWPAAKRASRVRELLELVGLPDLERRYPHELSGGQQQRIALARGLAPRPALLLLDEPFSSVDEAFRGQLRHDVRSILRQTKTTTILVTHDTEDALAVSDRIAVIRGGRLLQIDTPEGIYNRPRTQAVAEFFGKVNVLAARREAGGVRTEFGLIPAGAETPESFSAGIRPENLVLSPQGPLQGLVEEVVFLGRQTEVVLRSPSPEGSVERCVILMNGAQRPSRGDVIRMDVRPGSLLIF
jgi:iron(III) transport system ATP-binding protein